MAENNSTLDDSARHPLKPCPFCGAAGSLTKAMADHGGWIAACTGDDCPCNPWVDATPEEGGKAAAIAAWNRRAGDAK